jgi:hypothetical protein
VEVQFNIYTMGTEQVARGELLLVLLQQFLLQHFPHLCKEIREVPPGQFRQIQVEVVEVGLVQQVLLLQSELVLAVLAVTEPRIQLLVPQLLTQVVAVVVEVKVQAVVAVLAVLEIPQVAVEVILHRETAVQQILAVAVAVAAVKTLQAEMAGLAL